MIRVGIVEDDEWYLNQIVSELENAEDLLCVVTGTSVEDFMESLKPFHHLDILLLDIHLPGVSGIQSIPSLKKRLPDTTIIMCTNYEEKELLFNAISRGAEGYILKSAAPNNLVEHIRHAHEGGAAISPQMARYLVEHFTPPQRPKNASSLKEKDMEVLNMLAQGWSYKYIADNMGISVNGVRYYIRKLYKRMNVSSRYEASKKFRDDPDILDKL
ncbi:response regulator transcription factor [Phaeodactylibacter sp.]|uniref:response regulator transcription factor n=1 Tax=Phaeodactylibacter sp. TaxID=1940289 RepID=UPI0025FDB911|nr:response regulator transcription factor [Phaeodactylibacter sp.]MCI4648422.1 response regulator transcription factor [Phaeodactylibacter sp.]MCI5093152.1 response regulator transcription factor [Phaeodactylibacter sp.]